MALQSFGTDLNRNALWQDLTSEESKSFIEPCSTRRFYDEKTHTLNPLPENYFGVAARIAAIDYQLGLTAIAPLSMTCSTGPPNNSLTAPSCRRCAPQAGTIATPTSTPEQSTMLRTRGPPGHHEAVAPSLKEQMKLWWITIRRRLRLLLGAKPGAISYMDTLEIASFLGVSSGVPPAPLAQLAAAYFAAWTWLRNDFSAQTHCFPFFAFGRGDYSISPKHANGQQPQLFLQKRSLLTEVHRSSR